MPVGLPCWGGAARAVYITHPNRLRLCDQSSPLPRPKRREGRRQETRRRAIQKQRVTLEEILSWRENRMKDVMWSVTQLEHRQQIR